MSSSTRTPGSPALSLPFFSVSLPLSCVPGQHDPHVLPVQDPDQGEAQARYHALSVTDPARRGDFIMGGQYSSTQLLFGVLVIMTYSHTVPR